MTPRPDQRPTGTHGLVAYTVALDAAARCFQVLASIQRPPGDLADQVRRAASGMVLNLAEGAGRSGQDRTHHFRVAYGSGLEVKAALALLAATGHLTADAAQPALGLVDRVCAMLWTLMGK